MRTEFVYSLAALAAFPIAVNAQVQAENVGKITAQKDATAWTKESKELAPGMYTFKSAATSTGTADKKATVSVTGAKADVSKDVKVGEGFSLPFEVEATSKVTLKAQLKEACDKDFVVDGSEIQLDFDFAKVVELLQIEYNKVTEALKAAEYPTKAADAEKYSEYYDRIVAIGNADYKFYADNKEGLQTIYADQTKVTGLDLYTKIQAALADVNAKEKAYQLDLLDGDDGLGGLNTRYDALGALYVTDALTAKKTAAKAARDAYDADPTVEKLSATKYALAAYKTELEKEEAVKVKNEAAKKNLDAAWTAVYDTYYTDALTQIDAQYTAPRYTDLKGELTGELATLIGSKDKTDIDAAIADAYTSKTADAKQTAIGLQINEFKEQITRKVADYNEVKADLEAAYETYDAEATAATALTKDAEDFLVDYATAVTNAVKGLEDFIKDNDKFATVANLTKAAIAAKCEPITAAKAEYTKQAGIYADYKSLKAEVSGLTASLDDVKTAIDKDATDRKLVDFTPTTIWATTITDIEGQIGVLDAAVDANKTSATAFKGKDDYKKPLQAIKDATTALKNNALEATGLYATYLGKNYTADKLRTDLLDPTVEPKVDLTKFNVWSNQVTIDEEVKARTPYESFIDNTKGSITEAISTLDTKLADAKNKTEKLNDKADNPGNILVYLKTKAVTDAVKTVEAGTSTMEAIKANHDADELKFAEQLEIQECNGIRTNIESMAKVYEPDIAALQKNINDGLYGNVKGAKLQEEVEAINAKINAAKAVAAKADATKDELTKAYDSIKDLNETDIATAKAHALEYAMAFNTFTTNFNNLNGTKDDPSTASTYYGLQKKVAEQDAVIDGKKNLSDAQKTTYKNNVAGVSVKKKEGDKDVTYTIDNILSILEKAKNDEKLDAAEVTKYQGIIEELKAATDAPVTQADRMNTLEGLLAEIDFAKAKKDVLAKDPNEDGFYYKQVTGKYTKDYNDLKAKIEADTDLGADEHKTDIATLKGNVEGTPALAEANLGAFNAAKDAYDKDDKNNPGAVQRYAAAYAEWEACPSSQLESQKNTLETLKDELDELRVKAEESYNNGDAVAKDYKSQILAKITEIEGKVAEFTNPVNYNAQIALDNKATYEGIVAAHNEADATYAVTASIVNTYKNFQSTELKTATKKAEVELDVLLTCLAGYDKTVADLQAEADAEYAATVSPDMFDKDKTYKAAFNQIKEDVETLTEALSTVIDGYADDEVTASVNSYAEAIAISKAKVAKFSSNDKDLVPATITGLYAGIDKMLSDINAVKDDDTKIKQLDTHLVTAELKNTGIKDQITAVEQTQAQTALQEVIAQNTHSDLLTGNDKKSFDEIETKATTAAGAADCVANFASYKKTLNELKTTADQTFQEQTAKNIAKQAIFMANFNLAQLQADYQDFAAGYMVKATVDEIAEDLAAYDSKNVTAENAKDWTDAAGAISERVAAVYNDLYEAEVVAIEALIDKAKEENLTYGGANKKDILDAITAQENALKGVKDAVAAYDKDPKTGKSRAAALIEDLALIEDALNGFIKTMTDANETNLDGVIKENLQGLVAVQQKKLDKSLDELKGYTVPATLTNTKAAIQTEINNLSDYITAHADEMAAYQANAEAMLADIEPQIDELTAAAQAEKVAQDKAQEELALKNLEITWEGIYLTIANNQDWYDWTTEQLGYYGSTDKYANKMAKLSEQIAGAEAILEAATAEAEGKATTADKQKVAKKAQTDVTTALNGVIDNCIDINVMAKQAYIGAFTAELNAQVIPDTWSTSANYTNTDKTTLSNMWNALKQLVVFLQNDAEGKVQAEDAKNDKGQIVYKGVITTLNEGAEEFAKELDALKTALKDMSLAEDKKGHIANGGANEEITTDDLEALVDIILNDEECDLDACDVNGDGEVDVTDLVWLRYFLVHNDWPVANAVREMASNANDAINMQVVSVDGNITRLAINLSNETMFRDFQIKMQLPAGAKLVGKSLGERVEGVNLMSAGANGTVSFVALGTTKGAINGEEGAVLYLDVENLNGVVTIGKAIFVDNSLVGHDLTSTSEATGIRETIANALNSATQKFFDVSGRMMNSLKNGINIIRNNDGTSQKVLKK